MALANIPSIKRHVKNVVSNYSEAQVKVREATSNDPWGPPSSLMTEVAEMTYNTMAFTEIMQMVWKRLNDHGKNWRHVYKALVLLDYLIKTGSEKVAQQCKENIFVIQTLKDFQYIEENKDQGINVRERAKQLVTLLKDDEKLKNERTKALMAKKRFQQSNTGISYDGSNHHPRRHGSSMQSDDGVEYPTRTRRGGTMKRGTSVPNQLNRRQSELDECRPSTHGEEELQLQIALALSREEADKETEITKGDDIRLKLAMEESERDDDTPLGAAAASSSSKSANPIDDLLSLNMGGPSNDFNNYPPPPAAANDPWGMPASPPPALPPQQPARPSSAPFGVLPPPAATDHHHHHKQGQMGATPTAQQIGSAKNDPWASQNEYVNDPWAPASGVQVMNQNNMPMPSMVGVDPFAGAPAGIVNNGMGASNGLSSDPWNLDPLGDTLMPMSVNGGANVDLMGGDGRGTGSKTPEHFLGENSSLVNLDNLMGLPKTGGPAAPAVKGIIATSPATTNPFLTATVGAPQVNPFHNHRPSPTMNQMKSTTVNPGYVQQSNTAQQNGGAWGGPAQPQPENGGFNPFL